MDEPAVERRIGADDDGTVPRSRCKPRCELFGAREKAGRPKEANLSWMLRRIRWELDDLRSLGFEGREDAIFGREDLMLGAFVYEEFLQGDEIGIRQFVANDRRP